jgi:chromosome segregation ATPase
MDLDVGTAIGAGTAAGGAIAAGWRLVYKSLTGKAESTRTDLVAQVNGVRASLADEIKRHRQEVVERVDQHRKDIDNKLADMDSELDAYNRNATAFRAKVMDRFEQIATRSEMREDIGGLHRRLDDLFTKLGNIRHD